MSMGRERRHARVHVRVSPVAAVPETRGRPASLRGRPTRAESKAGLPTPAKQAASLGRGGGKRLEACGGREARRGADGESVHRTLTRCTLAMAAPAATASGVLVCGTRASCVGHPSSSPGAYGQPIASSVEAQWQRIA